jgi:hypothetical protein
MVAFAEVSADGAPVFCVVLPPPQDAIVSVRARRVGIVVFIVFDVF